MCSCFTLLSLSISFSGLNLHFFVTAFTPIFAFDPAQMISRAVSCSSALSTMLFMFFSWNIQDTSVDPILEAFRHYSRIVVFLMKIAYFEACTLIGKAGLYKALKFQSISCCNPDLCDPALLLKMLSLFQRQGNHLKVKMNRSNDHFWTKSLKDDCAIMKSGNGNGSKNTLLWLSPMVLLLLTSNTMGQPSKPIPFKPVVPKPVAPVPAILKPVAPVPAILKPAAPVPAILKPVAPVPAILKPAAPVPAIPKPAAPVPAIPKPVLPKPAAPRPAAPKPAAPVKKPAKPTNKPVKQPSKKPSKKPSKNPSSHPSGIPSSLPSSAPSDIPSSLPSGIPSSAPSNSTISLCTGTFTMRNELSYTLEVQVRGDIAYITPFDATTFYHLCESDEVVVTNILTNFSDSPSSTPSFSPSNVPSTSPSSIPSNLPSNQPSKAPSKRKPMPKPIKPLPIKPSPIKPSPIKPSPIKPSPAKPAKPFPIAKPSTPSLSKPSGLIPFKPVVMPVPLNFMFSSVKFKVTYNSYGWIGLGVSPDGSMIGSAAVIGLPDATNSNVKKYNLNAKQVDGIALGSYQDNVYNKSIKQVQGITTMEFQAFFDWNAGSLPFKSSGETQMVFAYGQNNILGYHKRKGPFLVNLSLCKNNPKDSECSKSDDPNYDQMKVFNSNGETLKVYSILV
jgi:hypothetical protein